MCIRDSPNRSDYGEISFRDWFSIGGFEFCFIAPDPTDPNIVYSGGWYGSVVRFDKITGQITPVSYTHLDVYKRQILGVDQGATISVDGGKTWSSWYNQPTGQFYHVITDSQFPYSSYAPQQDSGTVAVPNRSDYGEISFRDWFSIGGFEFCFIAPDPTNPNIVYSGGWYGSVVRFDKITGQITHVFVRGAKFRTSQMAPLVFSPQDPKTVSYTHLDVYKRQVKGCRGQRHRQITQLLRFVQSI